MRLFLVKFGRHSQIHIVHNIFKYFLPVAIPFQYQPIFMPWLVAKAVMYHYVVTPGLIKMINITEKSRCSTIIFFGINIRLVCYCWRYTNVHFRQAMQTCSIFRQNLLKIFYLHVKSDRFWCHARSSHHIFLCVWVAVYDSDLRLSSACQIIQSFKWNPLLLWKFRHISGKMQHVCMACLKMNISATKQSVHYIAGFFFFTLYTQQNMETIKGTIECF